MTRKTSIAHSERTFLAGGEQNKLSVSVLVLVLVLAHSCVVCSVFASLALALALTLTLAATTSPPPKTGRLCVSPFFTLRPPHPPPRPLRRALIIMPKANETLDS